MDKLRNCPICGSPVGVYVKERNIGGNDLIFKYPFVAKYEIRCRSCGLHFDAGYISFDYADGQFFKDSRVYQKRLQVWNRRAEK